MKFWWLGKGAGLLAFPTYVPNTVPNRTKHFYHFRTWSNGRNKGLKFQNLTKITLDEFKAVREGYGPCFSKTFADYWNLERKGVCDATGNVLHHQHGYFRRPKIVQMKHFKDFRIWSTSHHRICLLNGYFSAVNKETTDDSRDENTGRHWIIII